MQQNKLTVGVDLGGTKILVAVLDAEHRPMAYAKKKTQSKKGLEVVLERIVETVGEALAAAQVTPDQVGALGIAAPGWVNVAEGIVVFAPNLGWNNVNIKAELERRLGFPTTLSNDGNAGIWGEYKVGAGQGSRNCLGVFVGTGIGSGLVFNGKLYEGSTGIAGELGHMQVDAKGPACGCGRRGCIEALASRTAMTAEIWKRIGAGEKSKITKLADKPGGMIGSSAFRKAWDEEDKVVVSVVRGAAKALGTALGSVANLIDPDVIVLGGGVVEALGKDYLQGMAEAFAAQSIATKDKLPRLEIATLGDDAVMMGAALLAEES